MKTLLLIPDGRGVRNFVLGPFLDAASRAGEVHVLHTVPESLLPAYRENTNGHVQWHPLASFRDRPATFFLRNSLSYAQMHWVDSFAMRRYLRQPVRGSWRTRTAVRAARWIGRLAASPRRMGWLDRLHLAAASRLPEVAYYRSLLEEIGPSVLFCSHQRPIEILPPVLAARSLGIPTAAFIFSWDNLSSKGRIAAPFDHFLLWSDHMRSEMQRYYPDIPSERTHVVGTPQFDPYGDERLRWTREEFCRRIGADPTRPILCYSGGTAGNAKEDPGHVRILMDRVRSGEIRRSPQLLLRPCPSDDSCRYEGVLREFPEILFAPAGWKQTQPGNWAAAIPTAEDVQFMANLTWHADMNINFASTMTLDFAIHDKPVVNVAFTVTEPSPYGMPLFDYIGQFEHYRPVIELGAARFARSPEELVEHVNAYLDDPSLDREGRGRLVELEIGVRIGESSRRVFEVLQEIAA
jgi:hypothetical protein